jgi:transcriptional regulator CtsR
MKKFASLTRLLIFIPVLFFGLSSPPAKASTITDTFDNLDGWTINSGNPIANGSLRFTYFYSSVTKTISVPGAGTLTASIDVNNSETNCIGNCTPVPDTYAFHLGDAHIDSSTAHATIRLTQSVTTTSAGDVVLYLGGIDNGFWGGHYGPVMDNLSYEFVPAAPVATGYPADQNWEAVTYGDGKFVAVASSGDGNRVMTSTNGNYWVSRTSASNSNWQGITYADSQFVAVGSNAVMTSPDGITWTSRTAPTGEWQAITNCGGLFVATATWGNNYIMSSPDGIDWTVRSPSTAWSHDAVACSATVPRFVSVSMFGRGWSSPNGITGWSTQNPGAIVDIRTVAFGNGRFSWLEYSTNSGNRYGAYSTNGVNWTNTASAPANQWKYITYGGNKFIAVAEGGVNTRSAYSTDGANWTLGSGVPNNSWQGVAYGAGKYVAVANSGTGNRVMTSSDGQSWESLSVAYFNAVQNLTAVANEDGSVTLNWDAPEASNTEIYGYSVNFVDYDDGVERGGWGVWTTAANTSYLLSHDMFDGGNSVTTGYGSVRFKVYAMNGPCAGVGSGSCLYGPSTSADAIVLEPTVPTTTTSTTSTTSTSLPPTTTTSTIVISPINNTTTTTEPVVVLPPTDNTTVSIPELDLTPVLTPEPETTVTTISPTTTTLIETIFDTPVEVTPVETPASEGNTEGDGPITSIPQYAPEQETTTQTDEPPVVVPEAVQDAADAAVEDIFDGPMSNAGLANAVDDLVADAETPEQLTAVVNSLLDQELSDTQFATVIDSVFSEPLTDENFAAAVDAVFEDPTQLSDAQFEDAVVAVFDGPLSNAQFEDAVEAVFENTTSLSDEQFDAAVQAVFDEPLTTEQFTEALSAVFDEPITDEKFDAIIDAVLDEPLTEEQFEELVNVLESDTVTEEQVSAAVDSVIENGVTEDQAVDLATSAKVLESVDGEQATEIFATVDISAVTEEEAAQLVEAVQSAPTEVREAMESEINVFQGAIDTYVPIGSSIPISTRRVLIAMAACAMVAPVSIRRVL